METTGVIGVILRSYRDFRVCILGLYGDGEHKMETATMGYIGFKV